MDQVDSKRKMFPIVNINYSWAKGKIQETHVDVSKEIFDLAQKFDIMITRNSEGIYVIIDEPGGRFRQR